MARSVVWDDLASWERSTVEVLTSRFARAQRFWDIGAYAGIYTLLACATNPAIVVTAVEPVPDHLRWLRANLDANGWSDRVSVIEAAVASVQGPVTFKVVDGDITASGIGVARAGRTIEVAVCSLLELGPAPDVIKIDVEGHEIDALATGLELLRESAPSIVAECLDRPALDAFLEFVSSLGYSVWHLSSQGAVPIEQSFVVPSRFANFLAERRSGGA